MFVCALTLLDALTVPLILRLWADSSWHQSMCVLSHRPQQTHGKHQTCGRRVHQWSVWRCIIMFPLQSLLTVFTSSTPCLCPLTNFGAIVSKLIPHALCARTDPIICRVTNVLETTGTRKCTDFIYKLWSNVQQVLKYENEILLHIRFSSCDGKTGKTGQKYVSPPPKTGNSWSNIL